MTPRRVYIRETGYIGPDEKKTYYVPKTLWVEFQGFGLVSGTGYDPKPETISMNVIVEEEEVPKSERK